MKKNHHKKILKLSSIILLSISLCGMLVGLFFLYGPIKYFRELWITSAMTTMSHRYLATWFYSDKTINDVLAKNVIIEIDEETNKIAIDFKIEEVDVYESIYEEQILNRNESDDYKIIDIKENGYRGYLIAIYDSKKIKVGLSRYLGTRGEKVTTIAKNNSALVAINASGFHDPEWKGNGGIPHGVVVKDGKIVFNGASPNMSGGIIGFDGNGVLILTKKNVYDAIEEDNIKEAVEFGPFLIVNGKSSFIKGNGGWGIAPRTAIGQRRDGIVLFLIIDGRRVGHSIGADLVDMTMIMERYKAYNAANLDGGSSTVLAINGSLYNRPVAGGTNGERAVPNVFMLTK